MRLTREPATNPATTLIAIALGLAFCTGTTALADSLHSLSGIGDVVERAADKYTKKVKRRTASNKTPQDKLMKATLKKWVIPGCVKTYSDSGQVFGMIGDKIVDSCEVSQDQIDAAHNKCDDMRSGDGYPEARVWDVKIMKRDNRRRCTSKDLACKAQGTIWCEHKGYLWNTGSGSATDSYYKMDNAINDFRKFYFPRIRGKTRISFAAHSYYLYPKNEHLYTTNNYQKLEGSCYYFQKGYEPSDDLFIYDKYYDRNKVSLKSYKISKHAKKIEKVHLQEDPPRSRDTDIAVALIDGSVDTAPLLLINQNDLVALSHEGFDTKQYGYSSAAGDIVVAKDKAQILEKQPGDHYYNNNKITTDCVDHNSGQSGGSSGLDFYDSNIKRIEVLYGLRLGSEGLDGNGSTCSGNGNVNVTRQFTDDVIQAFAGL